MKRLTIDKLRQIAQSFGNNSASALNGDELDILYPLIPQTSLPYLEIGFYKGLSTCVFSQLKSQECLSHCVSIDPLLMYYNEGIDVRKRHSDFSYSPLTLIEKPSEVALPELMASGFKTDFCFIDGCHYYAEKFIDTIYCLRMLEVGGILAIHDNWLPQVKYIVRYLIENCTELQLIKQSDYIAVFIKKSEPSEKSWDYFKPF